VFQVSDLVSVRLAHSLPNPQNFTRFRLSTTDQSIPLDSSTTTRSRLSRRSTQTRFRNLSKTTTRPFILFLLAPLRNSPLFLGTSVRDPLSNETKEIKSRSRSDSSFRSGESRPQRESRCYSRSGRVPSRSRGGSVSEDV